MKNVYCLWFMLYIISSLSAKSAVIIIHGTWGKNESWYQPQGDFFKAVQRCNQEVQSADVVLPFSWSGKLSYAGQYEAAQNLVTMIDNYERVILIGHSHGATVGIIASQILMQNNSDGVKNRKIEKFYALGVPVDLDGLIYPDMKIVDQFYNLFSFGDYIQPLNDAFGRCFRQHERMANISVTIHHDHPSHVQLHHQIIGKELLKIADFFANKKLAGFENFCCNQLGWINFFDYDLPMYQVQLYQQKLLDLDVKARWLMNMALFRNVRFK